MTIDATPQTEIPPHHEFLPGPIRAFLPYLLLVLAILMAYGNVYDNAYVFDDDLLIQLNVYLKSWHHFFDIWAGSTTSGAHIAGGFYRPMQITLYLIVEQIFGGGLFWYHFLNLSLHIANTCLIYTLGLRLGFRKSGVFLATLIWTLHPLHTEAVTYMSATADPLFALFCLWGIHIMLPDFSPRRILYALPLFFAGLLSKETTAMFPLLTCVCLFYVDDKRLNWKTYLRTWPLWVVTILFVIWRSHAKGLDGPQTYDRFYGMHAFSNLRLYAEHPIYRVYTFLATLPSYGELMLWPHGLHMERAFSIYTGFYPPVSGGLLIFLLAGVIIIGKLWKDKKTNALSWGILWFFAAHAPDTGIVFPMNSLFLEHWMYLPMAGLLLGIAEATSNALQDRPERYGVACVALAFASFLGIRTLQQNAVWHTPESFYLNIFSYGEKSARSRNNLALYYATIGRNEDAITQFNEAVTISDTYAETRYNMAIAYLGLPNRPDHIGDAIDNLHKALAIDPKFFRADILLGDIYANLGDKENADYYHNTARELISHLR